MPNANHSEKDFPWTFYFNGVEMPKWGACWPEVPAGNRRNWEWEIGPRDFYLVRNKIDHVGRIESSNPHVFLYAVQEVLCLLFTEYRLVSEHCRRIAGTSSTAEEVYEGLIAAAFEMRERTKQDQAAFWTSGYEADRLRLMDAMRRAVLPPTDPEHQAPPHIQARQSHLKMLWQTQLKTLHQAASSKHITNTMRKKLMEL